MLRLLNDRCLGARNPHILQNSLLDSIIQNLDLSEDREFDVPEVSGIASLDLDPAESRFLLGGSTDGSLFALDLFTNGNHPRVFHKSHSHRFSVDTVTWYPHDTGMFVSSSLDHSLFVWDSNRLRVAEKFIQSGPVYAHAVSKAHCLIAVASKSLYCNLIDLRSGSSTHQLKGHKSGILTTQWSPKAESELITGSEDNHAFIWDTRMARGALASLEFQANSGAHDGYVNAIRFTQDGLRIVSFGTDQTLRVWDALTAKPLRVNFGKVKNEFRKGTKLSLCSERDIVFAPAGKHVVGFNLKTGNRVTQMTAHMKPVLCCLWNDRASELYSGASDRNLLLWTRKREQEECNRDWSDSDGD